MLAALGAFASSALALGYTAHVTGADATGNQVVTPSATATHTAGAPIPVGHFPRDIAITPNGKFAYVTNGGDSTVTPITLSTHTPGPQIPLLASADAIAISPHG